MKPTVVCDTSALIKLRKGGVFNILGGLFGKIGIPEAVKQECQDIFTAQEIKKDFISVYSVKDILPIELGDGENEAISLAVEKKIKYIIINDKKAIKKAVEYGLAPIRAERLLVLAKEKGLIDSVKNVMEIMKQAGEGIEEKEFLAVLQEAGELKCSNSDPI